jgi:hypothetical protein
MYRDISRNNRLQTSRSAPVISARNTIFVAAVAVQCQRQAFRFSVLFPSSEFCCLLWITP